MNYDPTLLGVLEPAQLAASTRLALPRLVLGRGTLMLLIVLRLYVVLAIPVVVYAFVHALAVKPA